MTASADVLRNSVNKGKRKQQTQKMKLVLWNSIEMVLDGE
jgi:hypothetical protein